MSDADKKSQVDGLKDVYEEIREIDSSALPRVREEIEYVRSENFLTGHGAITDTLTPRDRDPDARRKIQRTLPMLPDTGLVNPKRRKLIKLALEGVGVVATAAVGNLLVVEITKPDAFRDSFVRRVLGLHSNRRALELWRDELMSNGRTDEGEFINAIASHGAGFFEADSAIDWIERVTGEARLSDFSRMYLQINWANHYRYLGQTREAFDLMADFGPLSSDNVRLKALIINQKYMNKHLVLGGVEDYPSEVPLLNHSLAESMRDELGIDAASLSLDSFQYAEQISLESLCLKGWFFMNHCISADSENEAMSALDVVDRYRSLLVQHFAMRALSQGDRWTAVRFVGEAVLNYARIAPIAWVNGWSGVLRRCFEAFYGTEAISDARELAMMREYHENEKNSLRSPLWIQIAMVRAMADEVIDGSGSRTLLTLLPATERYDIRRHTVLQRTLDALRVAFGRDPTEINDLNTLFAVDDHLMRACVGKMLQERKTRYPI